jgi:hypothetical protein
VINVLLEKLAAYTLPAVLVALAAALSWGGGQTWRVHSLETEIAQERAERATERYTAEALARAMATRNAALQAEHAARQQEATRAYNDALEAQRAVAAAASADADSLRDAVACYAAGDCLGPRADTATGGTCSDRAATLGKLLTRTDRLAGRLAAAADRHADEIRLLKGQIIADREACGGQ